MNAKKSKNKNKSKPVQLFQENENTLSESIAKPEQVEIQNVKIEGSKVQELSIVEDNHLIDDVPKKPKRTKGKKKKDILVEDKKPNEFFEPLKHEKLEDDNNNGNNNLEGCTQEMQSSRKKKNKNKKPKTQYIDDEVALSPLIEKSGGKEAIKEVVIDESVNISLQNIEVIEKEAITAKKKKKKKNRLDSDKSEKTETENSCTFAFQKLLQSSCRETISDSEVVVKAPVDILNEATEKTIIVPEHLIEKFEKPQLKEIKKCEVSQTEVHKTKGKKQPPTVNTEMENKELLESRITEENIVVTNDIKPKEESPKPKAQIAKPVEKKRKVKKNLQGSNNESMEVYSLIKADENLKLADTMQLEKVHIENDDIVQAHIETAKVIKKQDKPKEMTSCEGLPCESSELSAKKKDGQKSDVAIKADYSDFVEVKTGKSKKKKNRDVENNTIPEPVTSSLDTVSTRDNLNVLSLQTESCETVTGEIDAGIIAPDFIDYPRSSSQMVVDNNNNNTIIQEITTPEELKLGIPIFSTIPMVQGSGESPETQIDKVDGNTKVTEIDFETNNSPKEKTDIKSKMIEVNRDMEELRRSIERSLAELTNIENSDSNIEKDFEEIFQNQFQESKEVEIEDSIIIRRNESSSVKSEEANIDDKLNDKTTVFENNSTLHNIPTDTQNILEAKENSPKNTMGVQPTIPARKDKGKGKSKKKGKQSTSYTSSTITCAAETSAKSEKTEIGQESKKEETSSQKGDSSSQKDCEKQSEENLADKGKCDNQDRKRSLNLDLSFEPIENFEDALTSSVDDVNETFELIANETNEIPNTFQYQNNPEINIIAPVDEIEQEEKQKEEERRQKKQTPVSQPKNLLGHTDIPVQSNKTDYKKEKNKAPNYIQAKVKIKDSVDIEKKSKEPVKGSENRNGEISDNIQKFGVSSKNTNQEFVYKYNFRKVFLQSLCQLCKNEIIHRTPCQFCSVVFYCSTKHKDEDYPQHQPLCFAVSTIAHLKDQKHIYADARNITGQEYRVLRMQVILSCEKILKRKLVPWEQEAMLYPRICADVKCREWQQKKLTDCEGCGQISFCTGHPEHLPATHQRWCKPYTLYKKLVMYHQNFGKLEPRLPTKVLEHYQITDNINEVLGSMYEEKIDISDIQYATLTQIASAALTTVYCYQLFTTKYHSSFTNGITKKSTFTIHSIGSELQSEVDSLNKWETFFLHLLTDIKELRIVFIDPNLNQSNLPLDLLGKIKLCENCSAKKRRVIFDFEDKKNYHEYYSSDDFIVPNIVCAFNPNIQRSSTYSEKENWPSSISCILRQKIPFVVTAYTLEELKQNLGHIKRLSRNDFDVISEPKHNPFSSVRPDRNFITDHQMPLLFKNYSFSILCGA